jgi:AcrR family transcriptional regulator
MDAVNRGRPKVEPDPKVRAAILTAALAIVHERGLGALGVLQVLTRARLSSRAFYRHFESKEKLVAAIFVEMARAEMRRLQLEWPTRTPLAP